MDLNQIEYFITVYQTLNFTAAAGQLHISQQGLSKSIQNLEKELDLPLFFRNNNRLKPTPYGNLFYMEAVKLQENYHHMLTVLNEARMRDNHLKIGFASSIFSALRDIETSIWHFREANPEIHVELHNETDFVCEEKIVNGTLDVAFCMGNFRSADIEADFLMEEAIYAFLPASHKLAQKNSLIIADLAEEPLITSDPKNKGYSSLEHNFQQKGFTPHIAFCSDDPQTHFKLVQKHMGISLGPEHWLPLTESMDDIKAIPVSDTPKRRIYLIRKKASHIKPALKRFLAAVLK